MAPSDLDPQPQAPPTTVGSSVTHEAHVYFSITQQTSPQPLNSCFPFLNQPPYSMSLAHINDLFHFGISGCEYSLCYWLKRLPVNFVSQHYCLSKAESHNHGQNFVSYYHMVKNLSIKTLQVQFTEEPLEKQFKVNILLTVIFSKSKLPNEMFSIT